MGSGEPIAQGCMVYGGGRCPSHGDRHGGDAPASSRTALLLTKCYQQTREEAVGCWGAGAAAVLTNGRLSEVWRGYGDGGGGEELGCCCGEEMRPRN